MSEQTNEVPEVTDLDCAFPTRYRELLPAWDDLTKDERNMSGPFCRAISMLFYKGGSFESVGIRVRDGVDAKKVMRYVRATAGDFGPKHEHKIGGIGHMLAKWCEVIPEKKEKGA